MNLYYKILTNLPSRTGQFHRTYYLTSLCESVRIKYLSVLTCACKYSIKRKYRHRDDEEQRSSGWRFRVCYVYYSISDGPTWLPGVDLHTYRPSSNSHHETEDISIMSPRGVDRASSPAKHTDIKTILITGVSKKAKKNPKIDMISIHVLHRFMWEGSK